MGISPELKSTVIAASIESGISVSSLSRQYGISRATIYKWRKNYLGSQGSGEFVELVREVSDVRSLKRLSFGFSDYSLSITGKLCASRIVSIMKILEV